MRLRNQLRNRTSFGALVLLLLAATPVSAQVHVLTAGSASAIPGQTVSIPILLANSEPVRGFSLGVTHAGAILTLTSIDPGAALLAANGGAGPAYFFANVTPANGPGGTCGAVLSFAAPLDDIPVGPANELVEFAYTASAAAAPGASSPLAFSNLLGNPPLETIVSVAGVTRIPTLVSGSISIVTAPVTNLTCTLADACSCSFTLAWTNQGTYDSILVRRDGVVVQTLAGGATSAVVNRIVTTSGGPSSNTLEVIARRNSVDSSPASCLAICPDVPTPVPPTGLACSVDPFTGLATLTWSNPQPYDGLSVSVNGALAATLGGGAVTTTVQLAAPGTYTICLDGGDICHVPFASACRTAVYEQVYERGDANADGSFNISDPVFALNFLFNAGPLPCHKALDLNDGGTIDIADVIFALEAIFGIGPLPPPPSPACGVDPTPDALTCASFPPCP